LNKYNIIYLYRRERNLAINRERIRAALSIIQKYENRWCTCGAYNNFKSDVYRASLKEGDPQYDKLNSLLSYLNLVTSDLWYLYTICHQLKWQIDLAAEKKLDAGWYRNYTQVGIDAFHTKYRSIFDTIARVVGLLSVHEGVPKSFSDLQKWIKKKDSAKILGNVDLLNLIASCEWYADVKSVREKIIHNNAQTMVFFPAPAILFQVHKGYKTKINISEVMFNENLVDFELYAGIYLGYLLWYLEELARIARPTLRLSNYNSQPKSIHPGIGVIKEWMERTMSLG
jgi:hypothetical protein